MFRFLTRKLAQFKSDRRGVTALEYGMIAALISVVIVGAVTAVGTDVKVLFQKVSDQMGQAKGSANTNSTH